jgi:alanyl-tRNA synthetase
LRLVLGDHVRQSGSFVAPDRLRFDFTHFEGMTRAQLDKVERLVNAKIMENHSVRAYETSLVSARESGVTALFGEKYGDIVRVLEVGNFSKELCGGTHVSRTSELNLLKITSEGSVGANLRRMEAVTSFDAFEYVETLEAELRDAAEFMKVQPIDVSERVSALVKQLKEAQAGFERTKVVVSDDGINALLAQIVAHEGYSVLVAATPAVRPEGLRDVWDIVRARAGVEVGVVIAGTAENGDALLLAAGTPAAVEAGFDAGAVVREMAPLVGGRGGGRPAMAQAGGSDASGIEAALAAARSTLGVG